MLQYVCVIEYLTSSTILFGIRIRIRMHCDISKYKKNTAAANINTKIGQVYLQRRYYTYNIILRFIIMCYTRSSSV